jgi:biopolymer transport protein ExbB
MHLQLLGLLRTGGVILWAIIALSIIAIGVGLERMAMLWRFGERARALADVVNRCLYRGALSEGRAACERSKSPLADVLLVGFERHGRSSRELTEAAVDRERQRLTLDLRARLWMLGTIGAIAPFVGLFGTVIGIMNAFKQISVSGGGGFTVVSEGISEALVTTAAGIFVAVEAVVIYNIFQSKVGRIASEVKLLVQEFLEGLRIEESGKGGAGDGRRQAAGE